MPQPGRASAGRHVVLAGGTYGQGSDNFASLACGLTNLAFCTASYGGIYGQSNLGKHVSVEYQPRSPTARATMAASCSCPSTDGLSNCGYCTLRIFFAGTFPSTSGAAPRSPPPPEHHDSAALIYGLSHFGYSDPCCAALTYGQRFKFIPSRGAILLLRSSALSDGVSNGWQLSQR